MLLRISIGLSLTFVGFTHFSDPEFAMSAGAGLGVLGSLGYVWGFILPALMMLGGLLLVFGIFPAVAAFAAGIALASIPAGLLLKSAMGTLPLEASMPAALNALIWLLILAFCFPRCCSKPCAPALSPVPPTPKPRPVAPTMIAKVDDPTPPVKVTPKPPVTKSVAKKKTPVKKVTAKSTKAKSIPVKKAPPAASSQGSGLDI